MAPVFGFLPPWLKTLPYVAVLPPHPRLVSSGFPGGLILFSCLCLGRYCSTAAGWPGDHCDAQNIPPCRALCPWVGDQNAQNSTVQSAFCHSHPRLQIPLQISKESRKNPTNSSLTVGSNKCGSAQERGDSAGRAGRTAAGPLITLGNNAPTAAFWGLEKWTCHLGKRSELVRYREGTVPEHLAQIRAC